MTKWRHGATIKRIARKGTYVYILPNTIFIPIGNVAECSEHSIWLFYLKMQRNYRIERAFERSRRRDHIVFMEILLNFKLSSACRQTGNEERP